MSFVSDNTTFKYNFYYSRVEGYYGQQTFVFIGHIPNSQLFVDDLDIDNNGYLIVNSQMETNLPGVYAAGEIADSHFRQVITSAGMGAAAAIQATRFLEAEE